MIWRLVKVCFSLLELIFILFSDAVSGGGEDVEIVVDDKPKLTLIEALSRVIFNPNGYEMYILPLIFISLAFFLYGRYVHQSMAKQAAKRIFPLLSQQFAALGRKSSPNTRAFVKQAQDKYTLYVSGRQNLLGANLELSFKPRQDLINTIMNFATPNPLQKDLIQIDCLLAPNTANFSGCVLLTHYRNSKEIKASERDTDMLTQPKNNDSIGPLQLYKDSTDIVDSLPLQPFTNIFKDNYHIFHSLKISDVAQTPPYGGSAVLPSAASDPQAAFVKSTEDQPTEKWTVGYSTALSSVFAPDTCCLVSAKFVYPTTEAEWEMVLAGIEGVLRLCDSLTGVRNSEKATNAMRNERTKANHELFKELREEEERLRLEAESKARKEALEKMTPAEKKKYLEKQERKKEKQKMRPKGRMMKIMQ